MILKASQRANGSDLAIHLMNALDNEQVEIAQIYGTVAHDLSGAFAEFEAIASGTKAKNYLYSLSINPPEALSRAQYFEAIDAIEKRLGLEGQARAVVFHHKTGSDGIAREHAHVVWSRIDAQNMKAIHLSHDKSRLMDMACELSHKFGFELSAGLKAWEEKQAFNKEKLEPNLAEKAQENDTGISAEERRTEITRAYERADSAQAFVSALEQKGYVLARGDRRGLVVVDKFGNPHSLTRYVKGHKAKDIKERLSALDPEKLPSVDEAKQMVAARKQAKSEGEDQGRPRFEQVRKQAHDALKAAQDKRRSGTSQKQQELFTRQAEEKLSLHAAQKAESQKIIFRVRSTVAQFIEKTPGLRSVLAPLQKLTHLDPRERHAIEGEVLARRHDREKHEIAREERFLARLDKRERSALDKKLDRQERIARELDDKAKQDFHEAAKDEIVREQTGMDEGDLGEAFNKAAAKEVTPVDSGDDERKAGWKERAERKQTFKPKGGKGFGK